MNEIELIAGDISAQDNTNNVEMSNDEIWFLKHLLKKYKPKKIVEVGISAGGNTVNLLQWKDNDAQLFSVDIAIQWYQDNTKLSGWMADELDVKDKWKIYRGYDYLDVYKEIGNDIDFIIIDTVHFMPGEFLTFLTALPQLKDGCIVVFHDIHLNILRISGDKFKEFDIAAHCTGLLFGGVSSSKKWSLKSNFISNIGAFIVDSSTRENIKDVFHLLCSAWHIFPNELNLKGYLEYIHDNYPIECYNIFKTCLIAQSNYFYRNEFKVSNTARVDIINMNDDNNNIEILNISDLVNVDFPEWLNYNEGNGAVIKTNEKIFDLKFKCINDGILNIFLRGPYVLDKSGKHIHSYVEFKKVTINNEDIINDKVIVCHDKPHIFKKNVHNGDIIDLHIEWCLFNPMDIIGRSKSP